MKNDDLIKKLKSLYKHDLKSYGYDDEKLNRYILCLNLGFVDNDYCIEECLSHGLYLNEVDSKYKGYLDDETLNIENEVDEYSEEEKEENVLEENLEEEEEEEELIEDTSLDYSSISTSDIENNVNKKMQNLKDEAITEDMKSYLKEDKEYKKEKKDEESDEKVNEEEIFNEEEIVSPSYDEE